MKLRLTSRIVLLFVLLTAMLLATVGMLSYRSGSKSLRDAAISEMLSAAIEKEAALDTWIEERLADLGQIANQSDVVEKAANLIAAPPASEQARSAHALLLEEFGPLTSSRRSDFIELFVMEPESGTVIASTSPAAEGKSKRGHPYFDKGKTDLYLQSPYHSVDLKAPAMTATIPLRATDGRVVAVLAARVDLDALNTIAQRRTGLRQTVDSFLFNAEQFPVTQPRFIREPAVLRRKLDTEAVRLCVARHSGVTLAADYRGVPSIAIYRWNAKRQLGLIVKIDQSEALAPVRALGWSVVLISGLALLAALGISFLLARTITRPLHTLHNGVRRFAEGNFQEPLLECSRDEVGLLAGEFNQMAARVAEGTAELAKTNKALQAENAERKRAAESVRAAQQLIEAIINMMPVRVFWKDKNLVYLGCNAALARDAGFADPKDIIGKDDYEMGWRDRAELYRDDDRQVIDSGCPKLLIEEPLTNPQGTNITILTSKLPLRGPDGEVCGVLGTYMDITERKRAELRLAAFANLGQRLNGANTAREAARIISEVADELLGWDACLFSLLSPSSNLLDHVLNVDTIDGQRVESSPGPEPPSALARRTIEAGGQLILKEKPDRMFPESQPFGDLARPSASIMYVPARKGVEVVGVMSIQSYKPGAYDARSLETLQALADHCGGALDRLRAQEDLRRSETKFRTLYDSTSDAVMLLDQKGFFDCNQATLAMFGCATREEFCSKHPADVSPPIQPDGTDSLTLANQHMVTAMEKGSYQFEWMHKRADTGETFPAEVLLCALELNGKRVLQGAVRDITERKRSEASLRLQSVALEAAANAIVITDQNGTIQSVNPAFTALTGYTAQEAVGQNPRILKGGKQDEAFYRKLWQTISSGQVWSGEMTNRRKDGSLYAEEMTITPLRNADGVIVRYIAIKQDITERKRVAEALRLSEEQFRSMFELASVGIAQAEPQTGQWLRVNKKMCEITGYSAGELLQLRVPDITHPEDRQLDREAFERVVRGEAPDYRMEQRYIRKDGALAWVNVNMTIIRDAAGQPTRTVAAIEDITERKRSEAALIRLAAIIESSHDAIIGKDLNSIITSWNKGAEKLFGYTASEMIGTTIMRLLPADRQDEENQILGKIVRGEKVEHFETQRQDKNGRLIEVSLTASPIKDATGKVIGVSKVARDITERKRAEEALREKERLLSESQRLGHIGSWFHDMTGLISWSEEMYRIFGVSPDRFTPNVEALLSLIHPDDRPAMQAWMADCAAGEKPGELEFRILLPDGTMRFISGHGEAVHDAGNRLSHMAGTVQDITERKEAETKLAGLQSQLLDASREAGMAEIATNVLHNVGNVLNSVNISTGLVLESVRKSRTSSLARVVVLLREHAHDLGEFITQDPRGKHVPAHLAQLSEHLLAEQATNVSELDSLRRNVEHIKTIVAMQQNYASFGGVKEMINVADLVEDSLRLNAGALSRHDVEVIREFAPVPLMNVEKHKVLQILVNLLRNAKHACQESERADKRLTVRVANGEGRVRISVIDNGVGIPPENLTRIFNHGFTTRKDGHGFGLHSGALAAKEMGGALTLHSDGIGQGATFTLELPCPTPENRHE